MEQIIEKVYTYKGMDIHYYMSGNEKGDAIVFLHPAFCDYKVFKKQIEYFSKVYHIICIDMVGHGNSQINSSKVTMGDMPNIIHEILSENKIEKIHIVGVSMGSLMAQGVANQFPSMVKSVTIVGGYSIHKDNKHILKAQRKEIFKWLFYIIFSMKKFRNYIVKVSAYSDEGKQILTEGVNKFSRRSFRGMDGTDKIFVDKEEPVNYPLLIICGEHDIDLAKDAGERLEALEGNAHYVEIDEAGHCANIDNAPKFNQVLEEFIESNN